MGFYDTILAEHECHVCRAKSPGYQTKALGCFLDRYKLGDSPKFEFSNMIRGDFEIHDLCGKCEAWTDGKAYVRNGKIVSIVEIEEGIEKIIAELRKRKK